MKDRCYADGALHILGGDNSAHAGSEIKSLIFTFAIGQELKDRSERVEVPHGACNQLIY